MSLANVKIKPSCNGERAQLVQHFLVKALAKQANIAWQVLLFASESLAMDKKVTPDSKRIQLCLASHVGQFHQDIFCCSGHTAHKIERKWIKWNAIGFSTRKLGLDMFHGMPEC